MYAQKSSREITDNAKQELKTLEVEKLLMQANLSKNSGDLQRAAELYSAALNIDKSAAVAYYEIAGLFLYRRAYAEAVQYAQRAVQYSPQQAVYVERLAQAYMLQGNQKKLQETLKYLQKLEQSNPRSAEFLPQPVVNNPQKSATDELSPKVSNSEKIASYEDLLQNPTNEKNYKILTQNYAAQTPVAWDSIAQVNEMAVMYFPGNANYYMQAAQAHYELKHYKKTVELLAAALENSFATEEQKKEIEKLLLKAKSLATSSE
ncbi:MAG: hypothetical protein LBU90_05640 [Bacteroidales bacterium]|nr:hypothetical protein [Bacteroidales bacterium]